MESIRAMTGTHADLRSALANLMNPGAQRWHSRMKAVLEHLFLSEGHNYYGHHGGEPDTHETVSRETLDLKAGRGIVGDRFFDWKENYKGQITFLDAGVADEILAHVGNPDLGPGTFRRNVLVRGIDLNPLIGATFSLQGIRFEGVEECRPCHWMDTACGAEGIEELMKGRGGLRCRILDDGVLKCGEAELEMQ